MKLHKIELEQDTQEFWNFILKNEIHISFIRKTVKELEPNVFQTRYMYMATMEDETASALALSVNNIKVYNDDR